MLVVTGLPAAAPEILWMPPPDVREWTRLGDYLQWLEQQRGLRFDSYEELWQWSVDDLEAFWSSIWEFFGVKAHAPYERVIARNQMPGASWFPGALLNYAEHMVGRDGDLGRIAISAVSDTRASFDMSFGELRDQVARARAGLIRLGVQKGDRVAAYLPNIPETVVAFLATASLGAIWASCAPEFGVRAVVDRFAQIEPKVLLAVSGYRYGTLDVDRTTHVAEIASKLPGLEEVVHVPYGEHSIPLAGAREWGDVVAHAADLAFEPLPFDHPMLILFSSGTTGLPKAIVHCHGGILVEHLKLLALIWDLHEGDRLFFPTTTAWMLWNAQVSTLGTGAQIITFDGNLAFPGPERYFAIASDSRATVLGAAPAAIAAWRKAGLEPARMFDLSEVREICTAGAPLPAESYRWIYQQFPSHLLLSNGTGGTEVCSGFTCGTYLTPVWAGEMSARSLGVAACAFNSQGNAVVNELGELVITKPMPSMPIGFWNDPRGIRYHTTYFDLYPGVWRQGDWARFTERGTSVVTGRSDATLNRGGVRLGSGDFYAVLEEMPEVTEAIIVHLEDPAGGLGELLLFVVLREGRELDDELQAEIKATLAANLSPRHVPDRIVAAPAVPKTMTGKRLELPVKRVLQGVPAEAAASRDALLQPEALDWFARFAATRVTTN